MLAPFWIVPNMIGLHQGKYFNRHKEQYTSNNTQIFYLICRFCDSPTEELDSRTPKGRAKRGRSAAQQPSNDLSNFTETRSSVSLE